MPRVLDMAIEGRIIHENHPKPLCIPIGPVCNIRLRMKGVNQMQYSNHCLKSIECPHSLAGALPHPSLCNTLRASTCKISSAAFKPSHAILPLTWARVWPSLSPHTALLAILKGHNASPYNCQVQAWWAEVYHSKLSSMDQAKYPFNLTPLSLVAFTASLKYP